MSTLLNPYCTLADVQRECENSDAADANSIIDAINSASRCIDEHCGRDFLFHDHAAVKLEVPESWIVGNKVYLPWPVLTLTAIDLAYIGGDIDPVLPSEYRTEAAGASAKLVRSCRWVPAAVDESEGIAVPPVLRLTGTFGYVSAITSAPPAGIPAEITRACTVMAAVWSGKLRKQIHNFDGSSQQVTQKSIPEAVLAMLTKYRIPLV